MLTAVGAVFNFIFIYLIRTMCILITKICVPDLANN